MKKSQKILTEDVSEFFKLSLRDLEREIVSRQNLWIEGAPLGSGSFRNAIHSFIEAAILYPSHLRRAVCAKYRAYHENKSKENLLALFQAIKDAIMHLLAHIATGEPVSGVALGTLANYITTYAIKRSLKTLCE